MKSEPKTPAQIAAATLASIGGKNGTGASKRRGGRKYYQDIAKKSAKARAAKAKEKNE